MKQKALIFLVLLLHFFYGRSQHKPFVLEGLDIDNYAVLQWSTENGLPQNNVHDIAQTPEGYIWLATFDGLVRYDGDRFVYFDSGTHPEITSSFINSLVVDKKGYLWVSSDKQIFKIKNDILEVVWESKTTVDSWKINLFDETVLLWNNSAIKIVKNDSIIPLIKTKEFIDNVLVEDEVIYFSLFEKGLFCYNNNKLDTLLKNQRITNLYKGIDHNVIARVQAKKGIAHYYCLKNSIQLKKYQNDWEDNNIIISSIISDSSTAIYVTAQKLLLINSNNGKKSYNKYSLGNRQIQTAFIDMANNIWIGTTANGLIMLYPKVIQTITSKDDDNIGSAFVYQDHFGEFFMNTSKDEVVNYNENSQSYTTVMKDLSYWTAIKDKNQTIWGGSISSPIGKKEKNKPYKTFRHPEHLRNEIYSFFIDSKDRFWIGTQKGPALKTSKNVYKMVTPTSNLNLCYQFMEDSKGVIWVASGSGLGKYDGVNFKKITTENGLPTNDIRTIYEDADGTYWIGTSKFGLLRCKDGKLFHFPYQDDRINPNVWTIVEDDFGYFWMSSNQGLYKLSKKQLNDYADGLNTTFNSSKYGVLDGLANPEFNSRTQNKGFKALDGKLWFSNIRGAVVVNPKKVLNKKNLNTLFIEELFIDKKKVVLDSVITLNPEQSQITITWSLPSYYQTSSMKFQVMLENKNEEWVDMNNSRTVSYSDLPPNDYTFKVRLVGEDKERSFKLTVESYFWETRSFQIAFAVLITVLIAYLISLDRTRNFKQKNNIISLKNELAHLEIKAMESKLNPHFIFNCLSSIQFLYNAGRLKDANKYLSGFSDLLRIIIHHTQADKVSIKDEIKMLEKYIPLEQLQFDEPFKYEINTSSEIDTNNTYIPSMIFHILVENAIKHGLKSYKNRLPSLKINFLRLSDKRIKLEVIDNGNGFLKGKNSNAAHKSMGLKLLTERIELMNQVENIKINLSHTNLVDEQNNILGCVAKIEIEEN